MFKRNKWLLIGAAFAVLAGAGFVFASRGKDSPGRADQLPFRLGKVQAEDLQVSVREVGVVEPEVKVDVKSAVSGRVVALKIREGAVVKEGDVLAEVEPDVTQAQALSDVRAGVTQTEVALKDAERQLASQQRLFQDGLIGSEALKDFVTRRDLAAENRKAARKRYEIVEGHGIPISNDGVAQRARVIAPMAGVVITKGVELGETVTSGVSSFNAGTVLFTLADLRTLLIKVNLNEVDIAKVKVGQPVRITLDAYPQKTFTGRVRFVAPAAKVLEKIKVFAIEIALDELGDAYRTGMSANVEILGEKKDKAVSVPLEALQRKDGATVVYRLKDGLAPRLIADAKEGLGGRAKHVWLSDHWKDYYEVVPVRAGIATLERVEILSGLKGSERVALEDPSKKKVEKDDDN